MTGHIEDADFYFELLYAKNPEFENYLKMIEQGDEERLVAETLKVNPIFPVRILFYLVNRKISCKTSTKTCCEKEKSRIAQIN